MMRSDQPSIACREMISSAIEVGRVLGVNLETDENITRFAAGQRNWKS